MAMYMRSLCQSFRSANLRKAGLSRTLFGVKKTHLVPKTPEGSSKLLKTGVFGCVCCASYMAYQQELISSDMCAIIVCTGVYCTLSLFAAAYLGQNFIGKMYTNKQRTEVVIAYVNDKGQRINKTFKRDELKLTDHPSSIARKYIKQVTCPEKNVKYNLYDNQGAKMDILVFSKIFPSYK